MKPGNSNWDRYSSESWKWAVGFTFLSQLERISSSFSLTTLLCYSPSSPCQLSYNHGINLLSNVFASTPSLLQFRKSRWAFKTNAIYMISFPDWNLSMTFLSTWPKIQNLTVVCNALQVPGLMSIVTLLLTLLLSDPWTQGVVPLFTAPACFVSPVL